MNKLSKQAFLLLIFAPTANAFLWDILDAILGFILTPYILFIAPGVCDTGLSALALDEALTCGCAGGYANFSITGTVDCDLIAPTCLGPPTAASPDGTLCAKTEFGSTFTAGGAGVAGEIRACFAFELGLPAEFPPEITSFASVPPLCLSAQAVGLAIDSCTVKLGDDPCVCEICDPATTGGYFSFNCSAVDLGKNIPDLPILGDVVPFIPGPASGCLGLAFNDPA